MYQRFSTPCNLCRGAADLKASPLSPAPLQIVDGGTQFPVGCHTAVWLRQPCEMLYHRCWVLYHLCRLLNITHGVLPTHCGLLYSPCKAAIQPLQLFIQPLWTFVQPCCAIMNSLGAVILENIDFPEVFRRLGPNMLIFLRFLKGPEQKTWFSPGFSYLSGGPGSRSNVLGPYCRQ